jgi:hypothetical protein
MSDKKKEVSTHEEKVSKPSDGVQKTGVISDKDNSHEFHKAHTKAHQHDKRPSELEMPAVQSFGIDGLDDSSKNGKTIGGNGKKAGDESWQKEGDKIDLGAALQAGFGTEQEKAVLARRHFLKLLDENETNAAQKQQVVDAMHKFEKRHGNNPKEIKAFYEQCSRLLDKNPLLEWSRSMPQERRVIIAEQTILQAANPDLIRQGDHNTCNVSTIEYRLYSKHPSAVAKMVADLSIDGRWESGNTKVNLGWHKDSFLPEPGTTRLKLGDDRSFASQIFQIGAVNAHYAEKGTYEYFQQVDPTTKKHEEVLQGDGGNSYKPNLTNDELINVYNKISNSHEANFILTPDKTPNSENCTKFKTQEELGNYLFKHKEDMPLILVVHTVNEPFWSEGRAGSDTGGPHVITIKSYDPVKGTVAMHNQWGQESDHAAMPLSALYNSTLKPGETINRLQDLEDNNKITVSEKLDLARLRWVYAAQGDANALLGQDLIDCMKEARQRWKTQHTSNEEQKKDWVKFDKILVMLSAKMFDDGVFVNQIKREVGH